MPRLARGILAAAVAAAGFLALAGTTAFRRDPVPVPRRHVVEIRGMAFHPQKLEVQRGDTIVWINRDIVPHTATSTRNAVWNTGPLQQGNIGRYVPRRAGEYPYVCQLHPVMRGDLIVR